MKDSVLIKIADKSDIENLYELNRLFENETTIEKMLKHFEQNENEIICIAYMNNIAAGYCTGLIIRSVCYENLRLDLEALFVKNEYRKKGIGKALLFFIEEEAKARGIYHFHAITNNHNKKARRLYKSTGFKDTGEIMLDKTVL